MKMHHTIAATLLGIALYHLPLCLSAAEAMQAPASNASQNQAVHRDQRIPWVKPVIPLISTLKSNRSTPPTRPPPTPANIEEQAYKQAFMALKNAQYERAITLYRGFIETYPNSKHIVSSHYWIAEACFLAKNYDGALEEYAHVMINFPDSLEAEQAALKSALTFNEMTNWRRAQKAFTQVIARYPHTVTAHKAQNHLKLMKKKGLLAQK